MKVISKNAIILTDIDKASILQEMDQLLHGPLVAWGTKHVLLGWPLFVKLEDEHQ